MGNPRSGRPYRRAKEALKAQGDTQCWRCGKQLYADLDWPHPNSITLGHLVALEDGGDLLDPANHAAECPNCNSRDGQRRATNNRTNRQATQSVTNNNW